MPAILPAARPRISREKIQLILAQHRVAAPVALVGIRGYYRDTMGKHGANDRGIYDDAICLISKDAFVAFNANVDPSVHRRAIAVLQPGVWTYQLGIHGLSKPKEQRYRALIQAAAVTVLRDGGKGDYGWFGINIHRGGRTTTSSLGCQTLPPDQWPAFIALVEAEMKRAGVSELKYVLTEQP